MPSLKWSLFCGEALPRQVADSWQAAAPHSILENLYGPTELTIACATYRWNPALSPSECMRDTVPLGLVYPGLSAIVVDDCLNDVPPGEPGELCVSGDQTFQGYWRAPDLNAQSFIYRTSPGVAARRFYRTGDRVIFRQSHYVFLGRKDQQIKILGNRVELGDIEEALRRCGCAQAVAIAQPDMQSSVSLAAMVTGVNDIKELIANARRLLPEYMVPREIRVIDEMPLNANGKVDRIAVLNLIASGREVTGTSDATRLCNSL
jgi:acyl-CoA synthetase (AMP-forming)/AMP-acid ligase II